MTTEPTGGQPDAEVVPLRAVPAGEIEGPPSGPAAYADVTAPGERKPVLPPWLRGRDAMRHHAARVGGYAWHAALYHGLRSPLYAAQALFWALVGVARLGGMWLRWWLFSVPLEVWQDSISDGHRSWHRTKAVHAQTAKTRAVISLAAAVAALVVGQLVWVHTPRWVWLAAAAAALPVLAWVGRPDGRRIVQPARVPTAYEGLTQDVIARALGSLGISGINQWLKEHDPAALFPGPVRQDGPGWRAEIDLPFGITATQIIERREQLASGLRRPLGAVWPSPVSDEHAGRLEIYVGREDVSRAKAPEWPLLRSGATDVFKPFPWAVDVRARKVTAPMAYHSWLIGSIPRQGKTAAMRLLACGVALDPLAEMWIAELKGTGDLDAFTQVAHRFTSGIDDDSIAYAAESLRLLRREIELRGPRIKALDPRLCPEKRVTREIAAKRALRLRPIVAFFDECQALFGHPKYGKQAGDDAQFIIRLGPAMGIILILATQRPDKDSLPTGVSANVSIRFALKLMDQWTNDAILGTSSYRNGIRATTFRPGVDAGLGYFIGEDPAQVVRTYFLDVKAAQVAVARARAARERAGTLTGVAIGEDTAAPARDVLADALACFTDEAGLHWTVLAERLAERWPDRYAGLTADAISAQLRDAQVPSVTVSTGGAKARGCRRDAIEAATGTAVTPRSDG